MTIIAYNRELDVVYVDRQGSFDRAWGPGDYTVSKITKGSKSAVAFAGREIPCIIAGQQLAHALDHSVAEQGFIHLQLSGFANDVEMSGFARAPDGKVFYITFSHNFIDGFPLTRCNGEHADIVEGCGASWFLAYRALGMSFDDAFEAVCKHHSGCGRGVEKF